MLIVLKIFQIWETERREGRKREGEKQRRKKDRKEHQCEKGEHQSARLTHADTQRQALNCTNGSSKTCRPVIFDPKQSATSGFRSERYGS